MRFLQLPSMLTPRHRNAVGYPFKATIECDIKKLHFKGLNPIAKIYVTFLGSVPSFTVGWFNFYFKTWENYTNYIFWKVTSKIWKIAEFHFFQALQRFCDNF